MFDPNCQCCPYMLNCKSVKSSVNDFSVSCKNAVDCDTKNVVYCIQCTNSRCKGIQYIGETGRRFKERLSEHIACAKFNKTDQPIGKHFTLPGHKLSDLRACIIEECKGKSTLYRKQRETYFISKFDTFYQGLNKRT